jgi:dephospho-CoA kinase
MFLIGLTGGIAAGKSTVAKLWQELGGIEIDADQVARDVVAKGTPGLAAVITAFGDEFLSSDGELNRKALAERIFQDSDSRLKLESIIHPLVRKAVQERLATLPEDSMVVYTVPLLVEADVDLPFDAVVTVEAPEDVRISRMVENRGMTAVQAKQRIAAQAKPIERAANADYILNSNQSIDLLLQDARSLWKEFQKRASN